MFRPIVVLLSVIAVVRCGGVHHTRAQDGDDRTLAFFEPVRGALGAATPAEEWTFEGRAGQVISILALARSGDLDPVLVVIGPDERVLAENDDLESRVRDAGLEALRLETDGQHTIRVMRYQGADGTTAGEYELIVTPGFARVHYADALAQPWTTLDDTPLVPEEGVLRVRAEAPGQTVLAALPDAEPLVNMYVQVSGRVVGTPSYAEFGLFFRGQSEGGGFRSIQFKVNSANRWTVVLEDGSGSFVLKNWPTGQTLGTARWTLAVLARDNHVEFYGNGELLGTLTDDRLAGSGTFGVLVSTRPDQDDPVTVQFDDVRVTTRLGTTYQGLPWALRAWDSPDPAAITDELAAAGQITPVEERDLYVIEPENSPLAADEQAFVFEPLGTEKAVYDHFLLGVSVVSLDTTGENSGCGLVYRWQDARNLDLAYVDAAGGFGVVQARDGILTVNTYDLSDMIQPGAQNKLLVLAQGDRVALYVNGALAAEETVDPGTGRVGLALLNYADVRTECQFRDVWVWPLLGEGVGVE